jgi:hypothetical protein
MAFLHGKGTAVLYRQYDLSSYFNDASVSRSMEPAETTAFGASSKTYIVGLKDGTVSLNGMFDGSANAVDEVLQARLGTEDGGLVTICYGGATAGNRVSISKVETTSYDVSAPVGDVVAASAEFQSDSGIDNGIALTGLAAVSATGNGTSQDNSASTANGGVASLHVTANSHDGGTTVKVQHSADNSTWADLATFTAVSASTTTSERVEVAAGTTVNRYLRANYTLAGASGSITFILSFARR